MHHKLLAATLLGAAAPSWAKLAARSDTPSLYHEPSGDGTTLVDDSYIVLFNKDHNLSDHYANTGVNVSDVSTEFRHFRHLNGYSAVIPNTTLVHELRHDPGVKLVQKDSLHTTNHTFEREAGDFNFSDYAAGGSKSNKNKRWQWLQRPRQDINWKLATGATQEDEMRTVLNAGYGVNVYVIDSGVNANSQVDIDRLDWLGAKDGDPNNPSPYCPNGDAASDDTGHGSACASIIAGTDIGVAPAANIISVKNFCSGTGSMKLTIQAFEDIAAREKDRAEREGGGGTIINFSQGWGPGVAADPAMQAVISQAKADGTMLTAAAGNDNLDASKYVPQGLDDIFVVGNMGHNGHKYHSSNYGSAVDIWAPGESVECADQNGQPTRMTGTSFSAPWVVGLAAVIISEEWGIIGTDVDKVWERITQNAIPNGLQGLPTGLVMQTGVNHKDRQANRPYAYFGGELVYAKGEPMDVDDIPDGGDDEIL